MTRPIFTLQSLTLFLIIIVAGLFMFSAASGDSIIIKESSQTLFNINFHADKIVFNVRLLSILLSLILIFFIYWWAKELIGYTWALLPAFLTAFSSMILGYGHYATPNIFSALSILITVYFFLKSLHSPSKTNLIITGLLFGLAQFTSLLALVLIPYFILIALIFYGRNLSLAIKNLALIFIIGYVIIVYPAYIFSDWNHSADKQIMNMENNLQIFSPQPAKFIIGLAKIKALRPIAQYTSDTLVFLSSPKGISNQNPWYYLSAYSKKESIPALLILLLGTVLSIWNIFINTKIKYRKIRDSFNEYLQTNFSEFSLFIFSVLYVAFISNLPASHIAYIIPIIPFIYILASCPIKKWFNIHPTPIATSALERFGNRMSRMINFWIKTLIIIILTIWLILEMILAAPYFLSYTNEFAKKSNNYIYSTMNFDQGQDLKRLQRWTKGNLEPDEKIAVDYFGDGDCAKYLGEQCVDWQSSKGDPKDQNIKCFAVSLANLQNGLMPLSVDAIRNPSDEYRWLENPNNPTDHAGKTILIYELLN